MMNFINPHAVLLSKENLWDIYQTTGASFEALNELMRDSADLQIPHYIVGWRSLDTGLPMWKPLTEDELRKEYGLEDIPQHMTSNFIKL